VTKWFVIAAGIGFPFWLAFSWVYEWTPQGLKRESEIAADASLVRATGRKLDRAIIAVLAIAVVLLLTNTFVWKKGAGLQTESSAASAASANAAVVSDKSIAVLPFTNESGKADEQFFSDGLSDDLITALSQFAGLKVISRNSAFQFRDSKSSPAQIGNLLGVAHLLEGSVQRAQDQVRITATLVNARDGSIVWSQRYDKPYKDLFALQDDITHSVADALQAKLLTAPGAVVQSDRPPSGNLAAYNAYLQGMFYVQRDTEADARKAIGYFEDATRLDPRYALAWASLAYGNFILAANYLSGGDATTVWEKGQAALQTALALAPDLAQARRTHSQYLAFHEHDWANAEAEAQRAYQLAPDREFVTLAVVRALLGHSQQAIELIRKGLPNDPLCSACYAALAGFLAAQGQLDDAVEAAHKSVQLASGRYFYHVILVQVEIMQGAAAAALQTAQQIPAGPWHDAAMALALQVNDDRAAADAALQTVLATQAGFNPYLIAQVYALRRDPGQMFAWLQRTNEVRDPALRFLLTDPWVLRYRDDPRFVAFCKNVGLPTATDAKELP
ncbi:MAG: hypothetical protein JSR65_13780, partial [Proteobacteria bacterium]|nr:hypothetical protein [Pseudomonadota bacterium]